jgi:hypothetical protein
MASFYEAYIKGQPGWAKGIIAVTVTGVVVYAGFTIYKNYKKKQELKDANRTAEAAADELEDLQEQGVHPTMSDSQFLALSESLVEAMNGCGTDNDIVDNVFKQMKNEADIRKLITLFGVRYYRPCAADQPISYTRWMWNEKAFGGGLAVWLTYDLDTDEIKKINTILKSNNIKFQF